MKTSEYWQKRFSELEELRHGEAAAGYQEISRQYQEAERELERQISVWYQRFAANNGISMQEARKFLSKAQREELQWDIEEYIKKGEENAITPIWKKQLENASARAHISRLDALKLQIQQQTEKLFGGQLDSVDKTMRRVYEGDYYHTAFELQKGFSIGRSFSQLDERSIQKVLARPWAPDGRNFSDRIWSNKQLLVHELNTTMTQNIILGKDPQKAIQAISRRLKVSQTAAGRLVMTESAAIGNAAQRDSFRELGVEQYEIVATLDSRTSEICRHMDGKHFKMSEWQTGVTAPPFHVNCRTATAPYFEEDLDQIGVRAARDEESGKTYYVPANMSYEEWKKAFVDGDKTRAQDALTNLRGATDPPISIKLGNIDVEKSNEQHAFSDGTGNPTALKDAVVYKLSDGTRFIFPKVYDTMHQRMTPEKAIELWYRVPDNVRKRAQKIIEFVDYHNPQDAYWRRIYRNFTQTYATGGDVITFYRYDHLHDEDYVIRTYCHEAGHFIDQNLKNAGAIWYSDDTEWTQAMNDDMIKSKKKSVTPYGENSHHEDFAESCAEYTKDAAAFKKTFPHRARLLQKIFT